MNNRERRKVAKDLGILKHSRTLPRNKRWEQIRKNQENGKRMHEEAAERVRIYNQSKEEDLVNKKIENLAANISKKEGIPYIDALDRARESIKNS